MEVILLKDLIHTGKRGEVVKVKPGFARNYLVPKGFALEATPANMRYFQQLKKKIDARHAEAVAAAQEIADQINGMQITIAKRVTEADSLYGSVSATEVAEELETKGVTVDKRRIDLEGGIKTVGDHPVRIDLHADVVAELTVTVVPEE